MIDQVTFVGMGALGIMLGNEFVKTLGPEKVRFLADGERLERYRREGATCNGVPCDFRFSDGSDEEEAGLLIFAVKAPDLADAMELAAPCVGEDTVILSVLNGVSSEEELAERFGEDKVLYSVLQGMSTVREGTALTCHSLGEAFIGIPEDDWYGRDEKLDEVEELFGRCGIPFVREEDIMHRLWAKFMMNVGVNQVCMAYELPFGGIQQPGEMRDMVVAAMNEARKVAACRGVLVTQKDLQQYLAVLDSLSPDGMPSMRQDGLARRRSEVELFSGTVLRLADQYGMKAPVNQALYDRITEMERQY